METTIIQEVMAFLFGRKYYANVVYLKGQSEQMLSSFIFRRKEDAEAHKIRLSGNLSYGYITTVSFRSRKINPRSTYKQKCNDDC